MQNEHNRVRNKTLAFRVSEEEYDEILMLSRVSGMQKQDYLISRVLNKEIVVNPNARVKKYLEQYLKEIRDELSCLLTVTVEEPELKKLTELLKIIDQL